VLLVDADPSGSALELVPNLAGHGPGAPRPRLAFPFRDGGPCPSPQACHQAGRPRIAHPDDVVIIDAPQLEDHAGIARSAMRYGSTRS